MFFDDPCCSIHEASEFLAPPIQLYKCLNGENNLNVIFKKLLILV